MIHESSLDVLQTTGLRLNHPVALEKLSDAGAKVDAAKEQVRLTADMVERALEAAPKNFVCAGRTPDFDVSVSAGSTTIPIIRSGAGVINYYDLLRNVDRPITIQDCRDVARLVDALKHIDIAGMPAPQDVPTKTYDLHALIAMLQAGRKHIWALSSGSKNLKYQLEMINAVAGGRQTLRQRPFCSGVVCLIEPLHFPSEEIERLFLYGAYNLPVKVPLVPMAGANAPYTLAGMLTHTNSEALGSLVLLQTLCPGIPSWYYYLIQDMEMHGGNAYYVSPEIMLIYSGLIQLARHYGIPSSAVPYATTNSQSHQIMFERGGALTLYVLSGATELGGAGLLDGGMAMSPHALVLDDEMAAYARRLVEGFEVDQETLAVDAINRVGHRGNFLVDDHTLRSLHRERRFKPTLFDWRSHNLWRESGESILERAQDEMQNILDKHEVPPLDGPLQKELDQILQSAEKEL